MAGIGFELKKLFGKSSFFYAFRGIVYASMTVTGPLMLVVTMLIGINRILHYFRIPYTERDLLSASILYAFIFSLISSTAVTTILSRYISDKMFEEKDEDILSSVYGSLMLTLLIGASFGIPFHIFAKIPPFFSFGGYILYNILTIVFVLMTFVSAVKQYGKVTLAFFYGFLFAVATAAILILALDASIIYSLIYSMSAGFFVTAVNLFTVIRSFFPSGSYSYLSFVKYFRKYFFLFVSGFFYVLGLYIHNFMFWFSDIGTVISNTYYCSPSYDMASFVAMLTNVPALIIFVVKVETSFYEKYQNYCSAVIGGGYKEIKSAKLEMAKTLNNELFFIIELQLIITLTTICAGIAVLPALGFAGLMLDIYPLLALGFYSVFMMYFLIIFLYYFDDRKGAALVSIIFFLATTAATAISISLGSAFFGTGFLVGGIIGWISAFIRLRFSLRQIDYHMFCNEASMEFEFDIPDKAPANNVKRKKVIQMMYSKHTGKFTGIFLIAICVTLLSGCSDSAGKPVSGSGAQSVAEQSITDIGTYGWDIEKSPLNGAPLVENKSVYEGDTDNEVATLYVTVYATPDKTGNMVTLKDLNTNNSMELDNNSEVEIIVQEGNEQGPQPGSFGYSSMEPNAVMRVRGHSSRTAAMKSFKIKLYDRAGTWRGQNTLNLSKHPFDITKVTNKFCYDYFEKMNDICGMRTQFVHLYVKDMSIPPAERIYEDYGLYTHVEQPNKLFLRNHGLDDQGNLYKAVSFEFLTYSDRIKAEDDPGYQKKDFESVLEIREGKHHGKLIKMLEDLNNINLDFNDVFRKHFNRDNYLTWMAVNILLGNEDTVAQNFMLYSPQNSLTWYFIPWDYDGSLRRSEYKGSSAVPDCMYGIPRYWGVILHRRFFRDPQNVQALTKKMNELMKVITPENTRKLTDSYKPIVKKFLYKLPDIKMQRIDAAKLEPYIDDFQSIIELNYKRYLKALQNPMPVFSSKPERKGDGSWTFSWNASYDLQGDLVTYDLEIAKDYEFSNIIHSRKDLQTTGITIPPLTPGRYYWRLIIKDDKQNRQFSFDKLRPADSDQSYWGVSELIVR